MACDTKRKHVKNVNKEVKGAQSKWFDKIMWPEVDVKLIRPVK